MDGFWGLFWWFFWIYVWVALLMVLFSIVADIFRDHSLNGWGKALWIVFLIFFPFLAILVYLIARGRGMAQRSNREVAAVRTSQDEYIRNVAGASPRRRMRSPRRRRCSTPARSARASSRPSRPGRSRPDAATAGCGPLPWGRAVAVSEASRERQGESAPACHAAAPCRCRFRAVVGVGMVTARNARPSERMTTCPST